MQFVYQCLLAGFTFEANVCDIILSCQQGRWFYNSKMALVCVPKWCYGLLSLQLPLSPPCLSLQTLPLFLLAFGLCGHFPYDSLLLLCSHLLYLPLQSILSLFLSFFNILSRCPCHHYPSFVESLYTPFPAIQGHSIPLHGLLRCHSCSSCPCYPLGPSTHNCCSSV